MEAQRRLEDRGEQEHSASTQMSKSNPFVRPQLSEAGDKDPDTIFLAVGRALSAWEHAEAGFAHLYGTFIKPMYASYAAKRSYGTVASARARKQLLASAAQVFFRNFPDPAIKAAVNDILKLYEDAGARRNEIAHGLLGGDRVEAGIFYFLVPSAWNSNKRQMNLAISYRYSSEDLKRYEAAFGALGSQVHTLSEKVIDVFQAAPEKRRRNW